MKCIIYTRFSPRPDAAESASCVNQERICRDFAAQKGYSVFAVFNDPDRSGADEYRPQLWAAIESLKKGDILLVYRRDRLARSVYLSEQINSMVRRKGGKIVAVNGDVEGDTAEAVLIRQIVSVMAEYERKIIGARTSDVLRAKQRAGIRVSKRTPYGWVADPSDDKKLVEDEHEQEVRRYILSLAEQGVSSRGIASRLNADGLRSRCGSEWRGSTIYAITKRAERDAYFK